MPAEHWSTTVAFDYASAIELYGNGVRSGPARRRAGAAPAHPRPPDRRQLVRPRPVRGPGRLRRLHGPVHQLVPLAGGRWTTSPATSVPSTSTRTASPTSRGKTLRYGPVDLGLTDSKIGIGRMLGQHAQLLLVLGIPTSTNPGYQAGTLQTGLIATGELGLSSWMLVTGTVGIGLHAAHRDAGPVPERVLRLVLRRRALQAHLAELPVLQHLRSDAAVQEHRRSARWTTPTSPSTSATSSASQKGTELWVAITEDPLPRRAGAGRDLSLRLPDRVR